jgi:D-alanine transfer protein
MQAAFASERSSETMMHCQAQPLEQTPHLAPALTAVILGGVVMAAVGFYARSLECRSITALAADEAIFEREGKLSPVKNQGTALQQAALETECLLPVYGSSELNLQADYNRPFQATNLFRDQPTGFTVFPVGKAATTCLIILQKLAAVGPALDGRKVAISVSPFWFFERLTARADGYANNFSTLHAGELAFNTRLSLQFRQDAARRMLQYPATLANRPLLRFALENMADGSPLGLACYAAVRPLGIMQNALLRNLDHWRVAYYLWTHPARTSVPISPQSRRPLDWPMLLRQADASYRPHSNNNNLGLDNEKWDQRLRQEIARRRNTRSDEAFFRTFQTNQEWVDLELLLRELTELGARTLLLSMPIHGGWYDQCGITYTARRAYYQKLREIGARHHAAVVDFADHDADRSFCHDELGHLAPRGLVYYNQVLDEFVHDAIRRQPEIPASAPVASGGTGSGPPSRKATESRPPPKVSTNLPPQRQ